MTDRRNAVSLALGHQSGVRRPEESAFVEKSLGGRRALVDAVEVRGRRSVAAGVDTEVPVDDAHGFWVSSVGGLKFRLSGRMCNFLQAVIDIPMISFGMASPLITKTALYR